MIGSVEFLTLPGSVSSVEYPLLTSAAQNLASVTKATFANVKFTEDIVQEIRVPYFEGYSECSMVRMNGEIYWIDGYRQDTLTQSTITFLLSYNGPSSRYHKGDKMYGIWERTGNVRECDWLQYAPFSGEEAPYSMQKLPTLFSDFTKKRKRYYVQISSTASVPPGVYLTGEAAFEAAKQDQQTIYAFYADVDPTTATDLEGIAPGIATTGKYPTLTEAINSIESLGIAASTVTDISISERSPFPMLYDTETTAQPNIAAGDEIVVNGKTLKIIDPVKAATRAYTVTSLDLPGSGALEWISRLEVIDENGSTIGYIPYSAREATSQTANLNCTVFCDYTGVYTRIDSADYTRGRIATIIKPEGKLPWVGSTWSEYRAFSMAFDRRSVANQNALTAQNGLLNMVDRSVNAITAGALIGGGLGIAVGGISAVSGVLTESGRIAAQSNYALKEQRNLEKRTQAQPGTAYAPQYGRNYVVQTCLMNARIQCMVPLGALKDSAWITQFTQYYGYPDDGVYRGLDAAKGYFKGKLLSGSGRTGPKFDRTNDAFQNGFRFIEV